MVHKSTGQVYALKILQKATIVKLNQTRNIMNEKNLLMRINHPFILKLYQTYRDTNCLYMLLELVQGGELFSRLQACHGRVGLRDAQFYAACVLDAFEHLHAQHILYRDLKPENLLIDSQGYIKVRGRDTVTPLLAPSQSTCSHSSVTGVVCALLCGALLLPVSVWFFAGGRLWLCQGGAPSDLHTVWHP